MPILHVRALPQKDQKLIQRALSDTCEAVAKVYGCNPIQVWTTWEEIKPGMYLEGTNLADVQPDSTHPPIVEMICFEGRSPEQIEVLLTTAASALSRGLRIPNNIFISYREAKSGQVIAGDGTIRKT
jgi:phenylpyruvate tautomerase PptA (4-oxalocrotonate tautomerase family)